MPDEREPRKEIEPSVEVGADEAKRSFGELINRVGFGNERIAIARHGKRVAALVSARDLERLEEIDARALEGAA